MAKFFIDRPIFGCHRHPDHGGGGIVDFHVAIEQSSADRAAFGADQHDLSGASAPPCRTRWSGHRQHMTAGNLLYMSRSATHGQSTTTLTFARHRSEHRQVQVQNKLQLAVPQLPRKSSSRIRVTKSTSSF